MSSDRLPGAFPRPPRGRRPAGALSRRAAGLLAALLACTALAGPGTARADTPRTGPSAAAIARALASSPVYVDPSFAAAVNASQQQDLADQITRTGLPVKVALVPLEKGDAYDGEARALASVLKERLGLRRLILITNDSYGKWLTGTEWPTDAHQTRDAAAAVGFLEELDDAGLAARISRAVDLVKDKKGTEVYRAETARIDREHSARPEVRENVSGSSGGGTGTVLVTVVAVLAAAGAVFLVRRRRTPRPTAFAFPDAVFAADLAADEAGLRRRAADELLALGRAVEDAESTPGLGGVLDAYDAAGRVLDAAQGLPDLAGVLALVAEGRSALAGSPALPLCFFDPRHGTAVRRTVWRPLGRRERADVAVCEDCGQCLRARRAPRVLAVRDRGRTVPYFEVPAERSLWAATGYGSLLSGPGDTLAARVSAGGFSRTRKQSPGSREPGGDGA
ncbi:hypothetical protein ACFVWY_27050 [Streptomyces sp. NPDC058195]|uniref:hypothetical protein n=1 Tax=Streptomyces sp. NPDC058195 TaxID=3346375 RepID=UPI0036E0E886